MLFNSVEFIFYFLPACLLIYFAAAQYLGKQVAIATLVFGSLFFYSWWNPAYLLLIIGSMAFNFLLGRQLGKQQTYRKLIAGIGIAVNLSLLGYFKYAGFLVANINSVTGQNYDIGDIFLPLAISFFTFQQIAYLVDSYKGITSEYSFLHYALFVTFFPQLIAGPIVHHKEMLPQFERKNSMRFCTSNFGIGLSIFAIGLFKKTVLADGVAVYATPVFDAADGGQTIDFFTAWGGALAYTFQLYFDFSGYSDMAIGLARMFGIVLPLNFYSPYKAANISEFWRRWHMTLSRFLRDYIYIPLGGNRHGELKRYSNLFTTMLLGGLWHGAGWNFIIWGALHGAYLTVHQLWLKLLAVMGLSKANGVAYRIFAWTVTFLAVVAGWVFFRATTLDGATSLLASMSGFHGISLPNAIYARLDMLHPLLDWAGITSNTNGGTEFVYAWLWIISLLLVSLIAPNLKDIFSKGRFSLDDARTSNADANWPLKKYMSRISWTPNSKWALICAVALFLGVSTLGQVSEFLYFQF